MSATLSTPWPAVLAMDWAELMRLWIVAREIDAETWGVVRAAAGYRRTEP